MRQHEWRDVIVAEHWSNWPDLTCPQLAGFDLSTEVSDGIGRLQESVLAALGHSAKAESEASRQFTEKMFADAKAKADAVQADIEKQYEVLRREQLKRE